MKTKKIFYLLALVLSFSLFILITLIADHTLGRYYILKQLKQVVTDEREYRIANPDYHHSFKPLFMTNAATWGDVRYTIYTNNLGFKDASNRVVEKEVSKKRVVFIGDSFTESIGNNWENSFVGMFAAARPDLEVLNAGVSSYYPELYYRKIKWMIDNGYQLDEVVVYIDISDIQDEGFSYIMHDNGYIEPEMQRCEWTRYPDYEARKSGKEQRGQQKTFSQKFANWYEKKFPVTHHLFTLGIKRWKKEPNIHRDSTDESLLPTRLIRGMWTYKDDLPCYGPSGIEGAIEKTKSSMDKVAMLLKKHNVLLSVGVYPWPDQIVYDHVESRQVTLWRDWCIQKGCSKFINHFPDFFERKKGNSWPKELFLINDAHFNKYGNRLIADKIISEFAN